MGLTMKPVDIHVVMLCAMFSCVVSTNLRTKLELERVCPANYGEQIVEISEIRSLVACSERCASLQECRSVLFDPGNALCKINKDEAISFPETCSTKIFYGRSVKATSGQRWLFESCSSDAACTAPHSHCYGNVCTCSSQFGYTYLPRNDSCLSECDKYGQQFLSPIPEVLAGYDDAYFYDITVDECRDMCIAETRFVCRAIEMVINSIEHKCFLTSATLLVTPTAIAQYSDGAISQLRICA